MRRLNGVDALMLYSETPEVHMHTLKIGILDVSGVPGFDFELFKKVAYPRLFALAPLRYQLVDIPFKLHHPMWVQNPDIDLDYHVRQATLPEPGGRRELDELIGTIASTPLDRSRPLWEMYVVDGVADNRIAVIHKVHHVLADGVASANQMAKAMQAEIPSVPLASLRPEDQSWTRRSLLTAAARDHVGLIRKIPRLVSETATGVTRVRRRAKERGKHPELARNFAPPDSFINHVVSPGRRFATAPLALADVKQTSKHLGVTLNDIVLATAAGALRRLLLRYQGRADSPLIAGVPVSYNTSPDRLVGNEFTYVTPSLPVHIEDPLERVRLTALSTKIAKEDHQLLGPTVLPAWMSYLPPALAPPFFRSAARRLESANVMNLTISNVPGPRVRGQFEGAAVNEIYSVGPVVAGSGLNITVWSYVDQLALSVLTDDRTLADPHEATAALVDAFSEIRRAAGFSEPLTALEGALPPVTVGV
ncbi:wax ester/triacylglycerol synthase family O-acyltransferase [Mycobacterium intermedium]|uniref:Diacylglycerol O-acyltransferase n=1 Tax=Mycobacterium intermedium TaxID=28445 RepID=A0A1E3SIQ0_MYCIE|nr:wax ester/triacylglycerol synthase family O-acyltransferase [Mycobacterium intermedium]MCV6967203.1 wax ester/triacylglycerol synthase family O-acyltransferase [Mycobacterium intermedium]ODR02027.1 diacylglycerol O-acyltransferase [Mycobacterium intermedium]OPE51308.1 diacylglycerol O-acyltransferase [Mycobacterium intermedium]ORB05803.1 wax ester/triacylglycerol synthase family O-acyltransferase [Mycobacterium intermedium]